MKYMKEHGGEEMKSMKEHGGKALEEWILDINYETT